MEPVSFRLVLIREAPQRKAAEESELVQAISPLNKKEKKYTKNTGQT